MAIVVNDLWNAMRANLGVLGTQRYQLVPNGIPAINDTLRQFNAYVGALLAEKKGSEELLREITMTRVFQTSSMSGVVLDEAQLGHKVWTVNAVYPTPVLEPPTATAIPIPQDQSQYRDDVAMRRPGPHRCTRVTLEQVPDTEQSALMPGSEKMAGTLLKSYAYYIVGDRSDTTYSSKVEVVVLPESINRQRLVVISYMRGVDPVTQPTDTIPYPASAFKLIRDMALNELSIRQGAQPLYTVTIENIRALLSAQG